MNKFHTTLAAGALWALAGHAHALIIDDFTTNLNAGTIFATGPNGSSSDTSSGSGILGGTRDVELQMLAGNSNTFVSIVDADDELEVNNGGTERSNVIVTWDDMSATDLTETGQTDGLFVSLPDAIDNSLRIIFEITGGGNSGSSNRLFADGSQGLDFFFPFSGFDGSINFESVTSISMTLRSPDPGFDGRVEFVETRPTPPSVPVPGTVALLGAGLMGLAVRRRMKRA